MKKIGNILLIGLLIYFSWFPMWLLYAFSSFLFVVIYYVLGYRKKVVRNNLKNAFPEKNEAERKEIEIKFFKYLCDLVVETLKIPSISEKEVRRRCKIHNIEVLEKFLDQQKSTILVLGHQGNYEWANLSFTSTKKTNFYAIYHPLKNKELDNFLKRTRGRLGTNLLAMNKALIKLRTVTNHTAVMGFVADQSPRPTNAYWTTFLNQETGVFWGVERMSKEFNLPVIFVFIKKIKRGYYELFPEVLFEDATDLEEGAITEMHVRKLEEKILEQPETWFWSHKRWKHKKPTC